MIFVVRNNGIRACSCLELSPALPCSCLCWGGPGPLPGKPWPCPKLSLLCLCSLAASCQTLGLWAGGSRGSEMGSLWGPCSHIWGVWGCACCRWPLGGAGPQPCARCHPALQLPHPSASHSPHSPFKTIFLGQSLPEQPASEALPHPCSSPGLCQPCPLRLLWSRGRGLRPAPGSARWLRAG